MRRLGFLRIATPALPVVMETVLLQVTLDVLRGQVLGPLHEVHQDLGRQVVSGG
jgi:hypothetical protein